MARSKSWDLQGEVRELSLLSLEKRLRDNLMVGCNYPCRNCRDMDLNSSEEQKVYVKQLIAAWEAQVGHQIKIPRGGKCRSGTGHIGWGFSIPRGCHIFAGQSHN